MRLSLQSVMVSTVLVTVFSTIYQPFSLAQTSPSNNQPSFTADFTLPDELVQDLLNERFSYDNAVLRLGQVRESLGSFQKLTKMAIPRLGNETVDSVGNTDFETQTLGFYNWTNALAGTLEYQRYQIAMLEYELAKKQFEDGQLASDILEGKHSAYEEAKQAFQTFLSEFSIAD